MDKIAVVDFGSQYTHLLARRIRQLGVYSEIILPESDIEKFREYKGIILSGGPNSVYEENAPTIDKNIFTLGIPVLGLCYGHQLIAHLLGGKVTSGKTKEYGLAKLSIKNETGILKNIRDSVVWMSHGDKVSQLPTGFIAAGKTSDCEAAVIQNNQKKIYGLQFHPEVTHSAMGMEILSNFIDACSCRREWSIEGFINAKIKEINDFVKGKNVFLLVSGGVDSTVCFSLLEKALGSERVFGLHIDNGFMRKDESRLVKETLEQCGFKNLHVVDVSGDFLEAVKEVYDPEEKRKIIGRVFIEVQQRELEKLNLNPDEWILAQGTIYPDTIESAGTKNAALIKTHHNRVAIIQKLIQENKVIEPIKELYKDEVRELGLLLGLPLNLVHRHPFPGPGLAVRCLCAEKEEVVDVKINIDMDYKVLPIKSVGVQGDFRTYRHPAVIIGEKTWDELEKISTNITNNYSEINRVLYLVSDSDLSKINVKKSYLTKERLELLRDCDAIVNDILIKENLYNEIWQFPVVLIPVLVDDKECIVLRPVASKEAMTAEFYRMDLRIVKKIASELMKLPIGAVFYDVTNKPPATIEWE